MRNLLSCYRPAFAFTTYFLSAAKESSKESRACAAGGYAAPLGATVNGTDRAASNASRVLTAAAALPWAAKYTAVGAGAAAVLSAHCFSGVIDCAQPN